MAKYTISETDLDQLSNLTDDMDIECVITFRRDYVGKGFSMPKCLAATGDRMDALRHAPGLTFELATRILARQPDVEPDEQIDWLMDLMWELSPRIDTFGLGVVMYWPNVSVGW